MIFEHQNRRELLQSAIRFVLFGAVGVIGAVLFRRQVSCPSRAGGCGGCNAAGACSLPWKETKK